MVFDDVLQKVWQKQLPCLCRKKGEDGRLSQWLCQPFSYLIRRTPSGKNFRRHRLWQGELEMGHRGIALT